MSTECRLLETLYAAFDARDLHAALATMHADIDWPNGMEGGSVYGHGGVRDYWRRQWSLIDSSVEPLRFAIDASGQVVVDVHQVIRDRTGKVLRDEFIQHIYVIEDGLIRRMHIRKPSQPLE